jgi:hypothetical protein
MKLVIEIDMKGEAFDPYAGTEVARILERSAKEYRSLENVDFENVLKGVPLFCDTLRDINGNVCGSARVEG